MGKPGKSSRPSALLSARWQDIDLTARLWHIPAADMKTKHPFTVPLSDWAVEILRELHTQTGDNIHLFPGIRPRRKPAPHPDHISIKFAHNAIRRLGYDGSTPGKSKHTMHGFRHLFTNISLTAGKDTLTTDLALGHISRAALQRADFSSLHHYLTASKSGANSPNGTAAATAKHTKPPPKTLAIKPKRYQYIHMADILPSDKRRQPPKTKGNPMNIIEQEMKHSSLRKVDAEIAKIIADAHKINAESVKIAQESRWYPMIAATGLVTAIAAVLALIFKFA
ncbi:TPA: tyrosine-type recombinase/integrase [Neisseria meningitidis]